MRCSLPFAMYSGMLFVLSVIGIAGIIETIDNTIHALMACSCGSGRFGGCVQYNQSEK